MSKEWFSVRIESDEEEIARFKYRPDAEDFAAQHPYMAVVWQGDRRIAKYTAGVSDA